MQRRLGPRRSIYAFRHPTMPKEPLVFVHVALAAQVPTTLADILAAPRSDTDGGSVLGDVAAGVGVGHDLVGEGSVVEDSVAVFYSISSPHKGLGGVPLGGLLIKQVVATL